MKALLLLASLLLASSIEAQTITTWPLQQEAICPRDSAEIRFGTTGAFEGKNIFQVQLSDAKGQFSTFKVVGSLVSASAAPIKIGIPYDVKESRDYRFRVISTLPYVAGTDNGSGIFIPGGSSYGIASTPYVGLVGDNFDVNVYKAHDILYAPYQYSWSFGEGAIPIVDTGNTGRVKYLTPGKNWLKEL
jgi:hypothetical protein